MKIKVAFVLYGLLIIFFITSLVWLTFCLAIIAVTHLFFSIIIKNGKPKKLRTALSFITFFFLAIFFRVFIIEIYSIPSSSMKDTLLPGDKIMVNKLVYGPKLPVSPYDIPWINLGWYLINRKNIKPDSVYWNYNRLKGYSKINHGDVIVFSHPLWGGRNNYFVKRCIALPGDTLEIEKGRVKINSVYSNERPNIKTNNRLWIKQTVRFKNFIDSLQIGLQGEWFLHKKPIELFLSNKQIKYLEESQIVDSIKRIEHVFDTAHMVYPYHSNVQWSIDNYGPLVIPYKGMQIQLSRETLQLYYNVIKDHEPVDPNWSKEVFRIIENTSTIYTFQKDYYFMLGDHRHNSSDSRHWGFLPEEDISGKATIVLFNFIDGEFMGNRIFRKIK